MYVVKRVFGFLVLKSDDGIGTTFNARPIYVDASNQLSVPNCFFIIIRQNSVYGSFGEARPPILTKILLMLVFPV
jgi:hypothetical protein